MEKVRAGMHGFSGACAPGSTIYTYNTFSLGIFEWIPKTGLGAKGLKKSAVKVRVKGPVSREADIYRMAKQICAELDNGTYTGPRIVKM